MNWTKQLTINNEQYTYLDLSSVASSYNKELANYPFSIRVLLESLARHKEQEALEELIEYDAQNPEGLFLSDRHE